MKISPLSFNLNNQIKNNKTQNQPNFKAVWSKQTLETARKVSKKTRVDVVKKLNDILDSNPRLKQHGGDKIELSLCSKHTNREFHYQRERYVDYYQTFCKATAQMPDGDKTHQVNAYIQNYRYPDCHGNYYLSHYSYETPKSEEEILTEIAHQDEYTGVLWAIRHKGAVNDVFDGLNKDIERQKAQEIKSKYQALMDKEMQTEVPKASRKLYDHLYLL